MKKLILLSLLPLMAIANYSIGDKVWYDKNQDWVQNADEPGYANVKVQLLNESGTVLKSTKTDKNGLYQFKNIPIGEYRVTVIPSKGANIVTEAPLELWLSENRHDINFGLFKPLAYSLTGSIWDDKNRDWAMDNDEPKVSKVTVELYKDTGEKVATTTSDTKGQYKFDNITIGEYRIKVIENNKVSIVTESPIELWVSENRANLDFGIFTSKVTTPPITREQLIKMINNDEDVTQVNTSQITDMHWIFIDNRDFNQDISGWDVSNVTNMNRLFWLTTKFNQDLSKWDVSSVTSMYRIFYEAAAFNQPINSWDVSNVTDMSYMFYNNVTFNQPLDRWDVSKVTNMTKMFDSSHYTKALNSWNVSNVKYMSDMFADSKFNQPLNKWDVSSVINMSEMFTDSQFNQPLNNWDVSNVQLMDQMFMNTNFNQPLNKWNVSNVKNMNYMFMYTDFNQNISKWNVDKVTQHNAVFSQSPIQEEYKPTFK